MPKIKSNKKAYSFQIQLDWAVRNLYDTLPVETRRKIKKRITQRFQEEIEICGDLGDEYKPLENHQE